MTFWTDERVDRLKKLWADSWSAREIARDLGCTRNAVIGKRIRISLPERGHIIAPEKRAPERKKPQKPGRLTSGFTGFRKAGPVEALPVVRPPRPKRRTESASAPVSIFEVKKDQCRWPLNDVSPITEFRLCGAQVKPDCAYCEAHYRRSVGKSGAEEAQDKAA